MRIFGMTEAYSSSRKPRLDAGGTKEVRERRNMGDRGSGSGGRGLMPIMIPKSSLSMYVSIILYSDARR
jgi:hypothetical protein